MSELNQAVRKIFGYDISRKEDMGIEAIGSIGSAIGNIASSIGKGATSVGRISGEIPSAEVPAVSVPSFIAPAFEAAPPGGGLAGFGPRLEGPLAPVVNEGPVGLAALKQTMPLNIGQINPVSELRFDHSVKGAVSPEPLTAESVIAEANYWLRINNAIPDVIPVNVGIHVTTPSSELDPRRSLPRTTIRGGDDKKMGHQVFPQADPMIVPLAVPDILEYPRPKMAISPFVEPVTKTENALGTQAGSQQQIESLVKPGLEGQEVETVTSERATNEQIEIVEEKEIKRRKKFVVDKPVLARRLSKIGQAIQEAVPMAERLGYGKRIIGWILEKFIPLVHPEYLSQVVRPDGPDGTLSIIRETIKAKNFDSPEEVETIVLENRPVSLEEEGEPVSDEEVRKVFRDRIMKPDNKAMEIVERRTVKKVQKLPGQSLGVATIPPLGWTEVGQAEAKPETNLEDLGLAEIFPKAA